MSVCVFLCVFFSPMEFTIHWILMGGVSFRELLPPKFYTTRCLSFVSVDRPKFCLNLAQTVNKRVPLHVFEENVCLHTPKRMSNNFCKLGWFCCKWLVGLGIFVHFPWILPPFFCVSCGFCPGPHKFGGCPKGCLNFGGLPLNPAYYIWRGIWGADPDVAGLAGAGHGAGAPTAGVAAGWAAEGPKHSAVVSDV